MSLPLFPRASRRVLAMVAQVFGEGFRKSQQRERAANAEVHHVLNVLGMVVEREHGRHDGDPEPRELEPRFQVNSGERSLTGHEHERPTLFDGHFRRAVEHVRADAVGDGRRRSRAARNDDHSLP